MKHQPIDIRSESLPIYPAIRESWHLVRGLKLTIFLILVCYLIIHFITTYIIAAVIIKNNVDTASLSIGSTEWLHAMKEQVIALPDHLTLPITFIYAAITWFMLSIVIILGVRQVLGRSIDVSDVFKSFAKCWKAYLGLMIIACIANTCIATFYTTVFSTSHPLKFSAYIGWIVFVMYINFAINNMALPLITEKSMSLIDALKYGFKGTTKYFLSIIRATLLIYAMAILGVISLGIGFIWILPLIVTIQGVIFREIFTLKRDNTPLPLPPYRSNNVYTKIAITCYGISLVLKIVFIAIFSRLIFLFSQMEIPTSEAWRQSVGFALNYYVPLTYLEYILLFLCLLFFFLWLYRANKNLAALKIPNLTFSPGMAVFSFFIPLLNLYWPYKAVKEIWQASHAKSHDSHWKKSSSLIILAWWVLTLTATIVFIVTHKYQNFTTASEAIYVFSGFLSVACLSMFAVIIKIFYMSKINKLQNSLEKQLNKK